MPGAARAVAAAWGIRALGAPRGAVACGGCWRVGACGAGEEGDRVRFEITRADAGLACYRWRLVAPSGEVVAVGAGGYTDIEGVYLGVQLVKAIAGGARVVNLAR